MCRSAYRADSLGVFSADACQVVSEAVAVVIDFATQS